MSERISQQYVKSNFMKKLIFNYKINMKLKNCDIIESYLLNTDCLSKIDSKLRLIISDGFTSEIENSYFLCKSYTSNTHVAPLRKYTITDGKIEKCINEINNHIVVIDLYEKSIYLHSYLKDDKYITGYLIKEEIVSEKHKTLIFSNEKVKVYIKNINLFNTLTSVDDFVNKFII